MQGWFKVYRGWMESDVFASEAYTEREAWLWLIENALIKNTTISVKGQPVELERGQLSYSMRFLAAQWGWHRNRVKRFLDRLKSWTMIRAETGTAAGQGQTIITICNYSKFQDAWDSSEQNPGQKRDRSGTNNKKEKEGEELKKEKLQKEKKQTSQMAMKPDSVDQQTWLDFLEVRKAKKSPLTQTAVKMLQTEARKAGWDVQDAVEEAVARNWQSFKAHYVKDQPAKSNNTKQPVCL